MAITAQNIKLRQGYKQTEIGMIPEDWELKTLGEITNVSQYGISSSAGGIYSVPILKMNNLQDGHIDLGDLDYIQLSKAEMEDLMLSNGDLLINRTNSFDLVGKAAIYNLTGDYVFASYLVRFRLSPSVIPQFVNYFLNSEPGQKKLKLLATKAVSQANINPSTLKRRLFVPVPPLKEQRAIATALSDVDALITSLDRLIAKKRDIKQATMQQLLTGKTRLPGFSGKWAVKKLDDVADKNVQWSITGGPFGSNLKTVDYVNEGVRIIQLQNIGDGVFHNDYKIFTSEEKADELISCNIYPGDIILSKMGDPVARACIVPNGDRRYLMASDGIRLMVNKKHFDTRFVHDYINSIYFRKKAVEASTGSTRQRIGLEDLKKLPFVVPSLSEQKAIATILTDMDAEIAALEQRRDKTRAIKQGMMQELLTGKTRLL